MRYAKNIHDEITAQLKKSRKNLITVFERKTCTGGMHHDGLKVNSRVKLEDGRFEVTFDLYSGKGCITFDEKDIESLQIF